MRPIVTVATETLCPFCETRFDRRTGEEGCKPKDGDFSGCWVCKKIGVFTKEGAIRAMTKEEWTAFKETQDYRDLRHALDVSEKPFEAAKKACSGLS